jgi:hypothetical protein
VQRGYVGRRYADVASRAFQAVLGRISLDAHGLTVLKGTSIGTRVGDLAYYLARGRPDNDLHGIGAFQIMYAQMARPAAGSVTVWMEAESGTRTSPMRVASDPTASGGRYLDVAPGKSSTGSVPTAGHSWWNVVVPTAGKYRIWGRVEAPTTLADSFWVRVDAQPWINWNGIIPGAGWHWDDVHAASSRNGTVIFNLAAGSHKLEFAYRDVGVRLDKLLITNAAAYVPSGVGG